MSPIASLKLRNMPTGVYPLAGVMALFVSGVSYFSYHVLAKAPDVAFPWQKDKHVWLRIQPDENRKILTFRGKSLEEEMRPYKI